MLKVGHCRCGRVKLEVSAPPLLSLACHCRGCQRLTASAFSLSVSIPAEGFRVTGEAEPVVGALHGASGYYYCPHCLSWLYTKPQGLDFFVNVRSTMFDEPGWHTPFIETKTDEKLSWVTTPAKHSFAQVPPDDAYQKLIAEYAALNA